MMRIELYLPQDTDFWHALCSPDLIDGLSIALEGGLGAGKTSLVRSWLRSMGVEGSIKSPTYTLCEYYFLENRPEVLHIDAYRLQDEASWSVLGLDIFETEGQTRFIEWCSVSELECARCDVVVDIALCDNPALRFYTVTSQSIKGKKWVEHVHKAHVLSTIL